MTPTRTESDESTDETSTSLDAVVGYIADNMAFEPDSYNESYLDRRVTARMRRTDVESYDAYLAYLSETAAEQEALLDALSINVTSFFRNPDVWARLRDVLRELADGGGSVRCWSAACADGREPYSIAMLARDDPQIDDAAVEVTATDIDAETLADARQGVYAVTRTTDVEAQLEFLESPSDHAQVEDDHVAVRDDVKRMVTFEQHDLISGEPKSGFDLVLCRNLLIYIDRAYKDPIFETLTEALGPGGVLTIGKSETLPRAFRDDYESFDRSQHIYRRV